MSNRTSVLTGGSNSFQTTAEDVNAGNTDFHSPGVIGVITNTSGVAPMTGGLAVNAQGTPDTTTAVTAGYCYVTATPTSQASQLLRVKIDAQNITHAANSTGSTRYDWIYVTVSASLAANPLSDASTTGTITVSRSTSSSTDNGTPPTYGKNIAVVTLANGFSSVTNGNIADKRIRAGAMGGLNDTNGNEEIKVAATASAVNEITVTNAATGNNPSITASGDDTNVGLNLVSKGTGEIQVNGTSMSGAWSTFSPTWTNLTVGNGTVTAKYKQIGKLVVGYIDVLFGSTSAVSGDVTFTLPVTSIALPTSLKLIGQAAFYNNASSINFGYVSQSNTTTAQLRALNAASTYLVQTNLSSTIPFTWATSFTISLYFNYEAA